MRVGGIDGLPTICPPVSAEFAHTGGQRLPGLPIVEGVRPGVGGISKVSLQENPGVGLVMIKMVFQQGVCARSRHPVRAEEAQQIRALGKSGSPMVSGPVLAKVVHRFQLRIVTKLFGDGFAGMFALQ